LRAFRKSLKDTFLECFGKQYYRWDVSDIRTRTKEFFTQPHLGYFSFDLSYYEANEEAFFKLIHNTYLKQEKSDFIKGMEHQEITGIFELVFKEHPT